MHQFLSVNGINFFGQGTAKSETVSNVRKRTMPSEVEAEVETNQAMARVTKSETVAHVRKRTKHSKTKDETNESTAEPNERQTASV